MHVSCMFAYFSRCFCCWCGHYRSAALDSNSEKMVVEALQKAMEETKSMIMVTHRLNVIRELGVNRVIVLERGRVVESGHPEELLRNNQSLYSNLAREQGIESVPSGSLSTT